MRIMNDIVTDAAAVANKSIHDDPARNGCYAKNLYGTGGDNLRLPPSKAGNFHLSENAGAAANDWKRCGLHTLHSMGFKVINDALIVNDGSDDDNANGNLRCRRGE